MCFYFLGFLRLLSDPPISISPLNQPTFNKKKRRKKEAEEETAAQSSLFFLKKLKYLQSLQGEKILSSAPASLHPLLQDTLKPSFLRKIPSHPNLQGTH